MTWHGMDGMAWHGMAWRGVAWRGVAWHGMAWHGKVQHKIWNGAVGRVSVGGGRDCGGLVWRVEEEWVVLWAMAEGREMATARVTSEGRAVATATAMAQVMCLHRR